MSRPSKLTLSMSLVVGEESTASIFSVQITIETLITMKNSNLFPYGFPANILAEVHITAVFDPTQLLLMVRLVQPAEGEIVICTSIVNEIWQSSQQADSIVSQNLVKLLGRNLLPPFSGYRSPSKPSVKTSNPPPYGLPADILAEVQITAVFDPTQILLLVRSVHPAGRGIEMCTSIVNEIRQSSQQADSIISQNVKISRQYCDDFRETDGDMPYTALKLEAFFLPTYDIT